MKKNKVIWGIGAVLACLVGTALFTANTGGVKSSNEVVDEMVKTEEARVPSVVQQPLHIDHQLPDVPAGITISGSNLPLYSQNEKILDERQSSASLDQFSRVALIEKGGKYPYRRVEETYQRNAASGRLELASRTEMAADHILVILKDGADLSKLEELNQKHGSSILRKLTAPNTYIVKLAEVTIDAVPNAVKAYKKEISTISYAEPDYARTISATAS
ncbi:MAG TPA: hypothetical protein VIR63_00910, partial [Pontiella sp.]